MNERNFNQDKKRNAEFITPPNIIKAKIGEGGLNDAILDRAQAVLENHAVDFKPLAEIYLEQLEYGINHLRVEKTNQAEKIDEEEKVAYILFPCVQLKANGTTFHYPLITEIADLFVKFLEVVEAIDDEILELALAFHKTMQIIVLSGIKEDGGKQGKALVQELNNACKRYFDKHQSNP